ncbi:MAG: folylpolyglutamate synthase/dihydrofolate synthase family protein [Cyclobacteriaceae bacterium]
MTYQETLDFLYQKLPMYQRVGKVAYKKDLTNTLKLLAALDNPHRKLKTVHIAGTNGKGSSAHAIAAILQQAGYKTGLYTSPHLRNFTERVKINGLEIEQSFVVGFVGRIRTLIDEIKPSFFEITVALAFDYFSAQNVDIAVVETGLGGRLDSTNVLIPEVCLITNIGLDHTDLLGDTLEKIAEEKAGIIKPGVPVVIGKHQKDVVHVFEEKAIAVGADLIIANNEIRMDIPSDLPYYKTANGPGILESIRVLQQKGYNIQQRHIEEGLLRMESITNFKGRFQTLQKSPRVIADVSHNPDGLKILFSKIEELTHGQLFIVFGSVKDKDLSPIFDLFPAAAKLFWTESEVPRSLASLDLQRQAKDHGLVGDFYPNVNYALAAAKVEAGIDDLIVVTGSTFVVADLEGL